MAPRSKSTAVVKPNLGLFLNDPGNVIPLRALRDGNNFRIERGLITNRDVGWTRFESGITLNGPVLLIFNYQSRDGITHLIFGTETDLYRYDAASNSVVFLTPQYTAGTADVDAADPAEVTVAGEDLEGDGEVKVGDQISFGTADENDPDADWYTIEAISMPAADTLLTLDRAVTGAPLTGSLYTVRRLFTGTVEANDQWEARMFINAFDAMDAPMGDVAYFTNGSDPILRWDGTTPTVEYTDIAFTARRIEVFQNMMIFGDITQSSSILPSDIINSDVNKPEHVSGGLSEQFRIHSSVARIVGLRPLGEYLAIYSSGNGATAVTLVQFVGDPLVFVFRNVIGLASGPSSHGAISGRFVADLGDHHLYLGPDGMYRFDGATIIPFGTQIWPQVMREVDPSRVDLGFAFNFPPRAEVMWVVPLTGDAGTTPETGFITHYRETLEEREEMPVSRGDKPFISAGNFVQTDTLTWETATMTWEEAEFAWGSPELFVGAPVPIAGTMDGELYRLYSGTKAGSESMRSFVRFGRRAISADHKRNLINRVYAYASAPDVTSGNLSVYVNLFDNQHGEGTRSGPFVYDLSQPPGEHFVAPYKRGRAFAVEFDDEGTQDTVWELTGYDVEIRQGGKR